MLRAERHKYILQEEEVMKKARRDDDAGGWAGGAGGGRPRALSRAARAVASAPDPVHGRTISGRLFRSGADDGGAPAALTAWSGAARPSRPPSPPPAWAAP